MLEWYEPLYVGERVKNRQRAIRKRLNLGRTDLGHYVITLASNGVDQLDIFSTRYLAQKALYARTPMVVGIAGSKAEAMDLLLKITEDCLRETGTADLRRYLTGDMFVDT